MPDESCRKCGGMLKRCSLCAECRRATQQICMECGSLTIYNLHTDCFCIIEATQETGQFLVSLVNFEHALA